MENTFLEVKSMRRDLQDCEGLVKTTTVAVALKILQNLQTTVLVNTTFKAEFLQRVRLNKKKGSPDANLTQARGNCNLYRWFISLKARASAIFHWLFGHLQLQVVIPVF